MRAIFLYCVFLLLTFEARTQTCTAPGQNPATAFPVCEITTFTHDSVPVCGTRRVHIPFCSDMVKGLAKNPFWYKFTCFTAGRLLFTITPFNLSDDYDFQLFDITGHNPDDVYTVDSLYVCSNWSSDTGVVKTTLNAPNAGACGGFFFNAGITSPTTTKAPVLIAGHQYLLLVSHYTDSQSGYNLSFDGGTAIISDPTPPHLVSVLPNCSGQTLTIRLNKKMKCSSITSSASEFSMLPAVSFAGATVSGAGCSTGSHTDTISLTLQTALATGNYRLIAQPGSDGNTLLDNCNNVIPTGEAVPFVVSSNAPTLFDSISPVGCAPQILTVVFRRKVLCSSIALDLSDFQFISPSGATITSVTGNCSSGSTQAITLTLSKPLQTAGTHQLILKRGTDGNTLTDECGLDISANSIITFTTADTVNANFTYTVSLGCGVDTIAFFKSGGNVVNNWQWLFDRSRTSQLPNPVMTYTVFGQKTARLVVSNGLCSDTATATIHLNNYLEAAFSGPDMLCSGEVASFTHSSRGGIRNWFWDFGNGHTSTATIPQPQTYVVPSASATYRVRLVVEDSIGCRDTLAKNLLVMNNCTIHVPTGFTPNGDGQNDYLFPLNAYSAQHLEFKVFNRFGQLIWQTSDWTRKWDGRVNGTMAETGTYVWFLSYTDKQTGKWIYQRGTTVLVR
jgi:gliding motility-associated-like protein